MKNRVLWTAGLSFLALAIFSGGMALARGKGTFRLEDVEGEREYMKLFPIEGVAGDQTHSLRFQIIDGELTKQDYSISQEELLGIFTAERKGKTGLEKYGETNIDWEEKTFNSSTEAAPSKDGETTEISEPDFALLFGDGGFYNKTANEVTKGETVKTNAVDVFLRISAWSTDGSVYLDSGIRLRDQEYVFTKGTDINGSYSIRAASYNHDRWLQEHIVEMGDTCYAIVGTDERCEGSSALFRIPTSRLWTFEQRSDLMGEEDPLYEDKPYGDVEILKTFPVDKNNRILKMTQAGEDKLALIRTEGDVAYFEVYDVEGNLLGQDRILETDAKEIQDIELETMLWDDGTASIRFECYALAGDQQDYDVYDWIDGGIYQIDKMGLKRLKNMKTNGRLILGACKDNLVFNVTLEEAEERRLPDELVYSWRYDAYFNVSNGETGKLLYQGKLVTDFWDDETKQLTRYQYTGGGYLKDSIENQSDNRISEERTRNIVEVQPLNGRSESIWWR